MLSVPPYNLYSLHAFPLLLKIAYKISVMILEGKGQRIL